MSSTFLELHPTYMGAIAEQTILASTDATYIGLAYLLPASLQSLCSCAGLFFARVVSRGNDGVEESVTVEVAALERYFDVDKTTYQRHVRSLALSHAAFTQLLEWDRRLMAMPTCDVREMLERHCLTTGGVAQRMWPLLLLQALCRLAETTLALSQDGTTPTEGVSVETKTAMAHSQATESTTAQQDLAEHLTFEKTTVEIPFEQFQESVRNTLICLGAGTVYRPSRRTIDRALLRTVLCLLKVQRKDTESWTRKRELKAKEHCIRCVLSLSNEMAPQIDYCPLYARGKHGQVISCQLVVDVPSLRAAE